MYGHENYMKIIAKSSVIFWWHSLQQIQSSKIQPPRQPIDFYLENGNTWGQAVTHKRHQRNSPTQSNRNRGCRKSFQRSEDYCVTWQIDLLPRWLGLPKPRKSHTEVLDVPERSLHHHPSQLLLPESQNRNRRQQQSKQPKQLMEQLKN